MKCVYDQRLKPAGLLAIQSIHKQMGRDGELTRRELQIFPNPPTPTSRTFSPVILSL